MTDGDIPIGKAVIRPGSGELVGPRGRERLIGVQLRLACALLDARGRTLRRGYLADMLWGDKPDLRDEKAIAVFLSRLRWKLAEVGSGVLLLSVRCIGYRLQMPESAGEARLLTVAQTRLLPEVLAAAARPDADLARRFHDAEGAA